MKLNLDKLIQAIFPKGNATQILKKGESEFVSLLSSSLSETPPSEKASNKKLANTPPVEKPAVSFTKRYSKSDTELKDDFKSTDTPEKIVPHGTQPVAVHVTNVSNDRQLALNLDESSKIATTATRKEINPQTVLEKVWQPIQNAEENSVSKKTVEHVAPSANRSVTPVGEDQARVEPRAAHTVRPVNPTYVAGVKALPIDAAGKVAHETTQETVQSLHVTKSEQVTPVAAKQVEIKLSSAQPNAAAPETSRSVDQTETGKTPHKTERPHVIAESKHVASTPGEVPTQDITEIVTPVTARPTNHEPRLASREQTLQVPLSRLTVQRSDVSTVTRETVSVETAPETIAPRVHVRSTESERTSGTQLSLSKTETAQPKARFVPQTETPIEAPETSILSAQQPEKTDELKHATSKVSSHAAKQSDIENAPVRGSQQYSKLPNAEPVSSRVVLQDSPRSDASTTAPSSGRLDVRSRVAEHTAAQIAPPDVKHPEVKHAPELSVQNGRAPRDIVQADAPVVPRESKLEKNEHAPVRGAQSDSKPSLAERPLAQVILQDTKQARSEQTAARGVQSEMKHSHIQPDAMRVDSQDVKLPTLEQTSAKVAQQKDAFSIVEQKTVRVTSQNDLRSVIEQTPARGVKLETEQSKSEQSIAKVVSPDPKQSAARSASPLVTPQHLPHAKREETSGQISLAEAKPVDVEHPAVRVAPQAAQQADVEKPAVRVAPLAAQQADVEKPAVRVAPLAAQQADVEKPAVRVAPLAAQQADVEKPAVRVAPLAAQQADVEKPAVRVAPLAAQQVDVEKPAVRVAPQAAQQVDVEKPAVRVAPQATKQVDVEKPAVRVAPQATQQVDVEKAEVRVSPQATQHADIEKPTVKIAPQAATQAKFEQPTVRVTPQTVMQTKADDVPANVDAQAVTQPEFKHASLPSTAPAIKSSENEPNSDRVASHTVENASMKEAPVEDHAVVRNEHTISTQTSGTKREIVLSPTPEVRATATPKQEPLRVPDQSNAAIPAEVKPDVSAPEKHPSYAKPKEHKSDDSVDNQGMQVLSAVTPVRPTPLMSEPIRPSSRFVDQHFSKPEPETPKETLRTHSTPLAANSSASKMLPLDSLKLPADVVRELSSLLKFDPKSKVAETLTTRTQPITPDVTLFFKPVESHTPQNVAKPSASPVDLQKSPEAPTQKSASDVIQNPETVKQETAHSTQTPIARMPKATPTSTTQPEVMPTIKPNIVPDARTIVPPFAQTPQTAQHARVESNSSARNEAQSERTTQTVNAAAPERNTQAQNQNNSETSSQNPDRDHTQAGAKATVDHAPQTTPHTAAVRSQTMQQHALNESLKVALQQALEMSRKRLVEPNELRLSVPLGDMGTMDIDVVRDSEKLSIRIGADQRALAVLEDQKPYLTQWLRDQGYPVEQLDLTPRSNGNPNTGLNSSDTSAQDRQASRSQQSGSSRSGSPTDLPDLPEPAVRPTTSGRHVWTA